MPDRVIKGFRALCSCLFGGKAVRCKAWVLFLLAQCCWAQDYNGLAGLLQVPSAEADAAGTFRGGAMFLHRDFLPVQMPDKNTMNYAIGITPFRWLELSYCASLLYMYKNWDIKEEQGYYNEDRRVNVKVTPLYEGKCWPAVAVGMDDIGRFNRISSGRNRNNYFQNIYGVATKHIDIRGWKLGTHLAYRYYTSDRNSNRRGMAGGLTLRPGIYWMKGGEAYRPLRFVAEWDGIGVNVGADVLLWRHLFIQTALVHGCGFTGGVSYHCRMPY